jgi:hypothetical protein
VGSSRPAAAGHPSLGCGRRGPGWPGRPAAQPGAGAGCRPRRWADTGTDDPAAAGEAQPAALGAEPEQDLSDGQTDQLGIAELGLATGTPTGTEPLINPDVECDDEGVEIGVHEASQEVDVAFATPILGALVSVVTAQHPQAHSEAII